MDTPKSSGYFFPAEWQKHEATWLTFPSHEESFPGKMDKIIPPYMAFMKAISKGEKVRINVHDEKVKNKVIKLLEQYNIDKSKIELFINPSDDVWCRDHGPVFLINPDIYENNKIIIDWEFNAWGSKYPFENDNAIPSLIAEKLGYKTYKTGIIMEGGSVELNGTGTLITSSACLLNYNRNPHLNKEQLELYLMNYYGVDQILWLTEGIAGDDTDGHIDDLTRFVSEDTVITMVELNQNDDNHRPLKENLELLKTFKLPDGKTLNIVEIPMPDAVHYNGNRLPASYANFYICNYAVIVPTFRCENDKIAIDIFEQLFKDRKVIDIDATDIVWGFGSFHCLSQQEPSAEQGE